MRAYTRDRYDGRGRACSTSCGRARFRLHGRFVGIVGAAGGLGGFIPPLVMGSIFGRSGDYGAGLIALAAMAVLVLLLAASMRRTPTPHAA